MSFIDPLADAPANILRLPRDERGRPVPWFVKWYDNRPDFRVIGEQKVSRALAGSRCWICGERLGRYVAFVIGPMCAVNRISAEPPSHRDCAVYAATHCPFLVTPRMHRQEHNMPEHQGMPGIALLHNPGACAVWIVRDFQVVNTRGGRLLEIGEPTEVAWYREGRPATREEVLAAIDKGLPELAKLCTDKAAEDLLADMVRRAKRWIPAPEPVS